MTIKAQQIELDNALVALENHRVIGKCNMRINPRMKPKEATYQVVLDALALTTCYPAFLITAEVHVIYMHQEILNICPKVRGKAFDEPPTEEEALSFIRELGHTGEIKYITDVISISWRNKIFMHTARDDSLLGTMRFVSRHADTQIYDAILPQAMINQALLDSVAYKTYYTISSGAEPPNPRKGQKKSKSTISSEESPSKKKPSKDKKDGSTKPKPTKKKVPVKADRGKGLNVLSEVALSEAAQLKEAIKRSKKESHTPHASGSGNGTDLGSGVSDEQHNKTSGTDEGTGIIPGVPDVPKYDSESEKESRGDSDEEDDDEDNSGDESDDDDNDDNDGDDNDDNDGDDYNDDDGDNVDDVDKQEDDDKNDDKEDTDSDKTKSDTINIPVLNHSTTEEEEEKINDEENIDDEEEDEVTKELYKDLNVNLGNKDVDMTNTDQGGVDQQNVSQESGLEQVEEDTHMTLTLVLDTQKTDDPMQSSYVSSDFTSKLLNFDNTSPRHEETSSQTSSLFTVLVIAIPENTSVSTIPPPPPFFNPPLQPQTTPTFSEATTSNPALPDFASLFKFNERVTNLEKDLSEIKQVDQYAKALSSFFAIVDRYIDKKLGEAIQNVIQTHNLDSAVLAKSSSQPQSTYEAAAALSEFELTKILIDKMEKNKSYDKADYKRELMMHCRDNRDKDQDPSARSDRGSKRRKSRKEAESSKDLRLKEKKSSNTSKGTSHSQHKPSGKSAYAEDPSHTVDDSGVKQNQEFDT
ncbi:hypothetical protein Tco_1411413, partial [Tanacetum coccineum]